MHSNFMRPWVGLNLDASFVLSCAVSGTSWAASGKNHLKRFVRKQVCSILFVQVACCMWISWLICSTHKKSIGAYSMCLDQAHVALFFAMVAEIMFAMCVFSKRFSVLFWAARWLSRAIFVFL